MGRHDPRQGRGEGGGRRFHRSDPVGQPGRGIVRAPRDGTEHRPARRAGDIRQHAAQLEIAAFQALGEPVALAGAVLREARPVAGEFAQPPLRPVRDITGGDQPMAEPVRDPLRIAHITLPPGNGRDALRIGQQQRQVRVLQDIPHGLPVRARGLPRHSLAARRGQLVPQRDPLGGGGALHGAPVNLLLGLKGPTEATTSARCRDEIRRPAFSFLVVARQGRGELLRTTARETTRPPR